MFFFIHRKKRREHRTINEFWQKSIADQITFIAMAR